MYRSRKDLWPFSCRDPGWSVFTNVSRDIFLTHTAHGMTTITTLSVLVANPKNYFFTRWPANPARDLLNRYKMAKIISLAAHHAARSEKIKYKSRDASKCLGATQVSVRLASVEGFLRLVG